MSDLEYYAPENIRLNDVHSDFQLQAQIDVLDENDSGPGATFILAGTTRTVNF